ncbi:carbon-nitrogen hydrolase family protein [Thalassotalea atypica]|uniref:carbon-nitrogen hydrolase family protein n=1 Tax=Thalassotalea atypica TaxID=2054316 RepID=UPI00257396D6|nr:carbon-nitrogen hydrolase family protein [Thalassotalea atypica]
MNVTSADTLIVGLAQIAPVWLSKEATLDKVVDMIFHAESFNCQLIAFGEALVPGYPFWLELTHGARFNAPDQKRLHAHYVNQAVNIEAGDLTPVCRAAAETQIALYLGVIERATDRGGHSLYCSMVYINNKGEIKSVHRKLMPTYEERLAWSPGDGHGLRVHKLGAFTVGGLNCWENWMPLPRAALYGLGEDLHVAIWPGGEHNTHDITRFMAKEGRSYVMSVSGLMRPIDIPEHTPHVDDIMAAINTDYLANGASCLAGPDGNWLIEPQIGKEGLYTAVIDHVKVREERQNFDPVGHYSRPDVTELHVNRKRQSTVKFIEKT